MNTLRTVKSLNTRTNARKLTNYLKGKGLPAVAPRKKDDSGRWDVSLTVSKGSLGRKAYTVVNGKAIVSKGNTYLTGKVLQDKVITATLNNFA